MRKITTMAFLGTLVLFTVGADSSGCGGGATDDPAANYPKTCTGNTDCASEEVCHPIGLVCVKDCKDDATVCGEDLCVETTAGGRTESVCKCETCSVSGEVCSQDLDDVCETACTSDSDCAAFTGQSRKCNTGTGICEFVAEPCGGCPGGKVCNTATDTCVDPCSTTSCNTSALPKCGASGLCEACVADLDCAGVGANYKCDKTGTSPKCVSTAVSCNSSVPAPGNNGGPDTCNYSEVCSSSVCVADALPDGTCADGYSWDPTSSRRGPVIVSVSGESFTGTGVACSAGGGKECCADGSRDCCGGGTGGFRVDIEFYAPNGIGSGDWTAKSQMIKFIKPDGTVIDAGHFADFPSAGATYSITPLHAGGCATSGTGGIPVTDWSVYLVDADGAGGNAACL